MYLIAGYSSFFEHLLVLHLLGVLEVAWLALPYLRERYGRTLSWTFLVLGWVMGACLGLYLHRDGHAARWTTPWFELSCFPLSALWGVMVCVLVPAFIFRAAEFAMKRAKH